MENYFLNTIMKYPCINVMDVINKSDEVIIFGASGNGIFVHEALKQCGVKIKCFTDNDSAKWKTSVNGSRVIPPQELPAVINGKTLICIASNWAKDIGLQLSGMGIESYIDLSYFFYEGWKPHFDHELLKKNINNLDAVYHMLEDDESKDVYLSLILYRMTLNPMWKPVPEYRQYFHPLIRPKINDVIFDAGAYIGDTAIDFAKLLKNQCQIYAIEPEKTTFEALNRNLKSRKLEDIVTAIPYGLWSERNRLYIEADPTMGYAIVNEGKQAIDLISLDEYIENSGAIPNLIKMDLEGSELQALQGAKHTISMQKPKLQICVYHKSDDLWTIPLYIKQLNAEYRFYLGHHAEGYCETVLYAG